jgi:DNA gyrase subunit A
MGVINIKTSERNGPVIALLEVFESEQIIMISEHGQSTRSAIGEIREISRATQGVRLMQVAEGDKIAAVARIEEDEVSVEENGSETEGGGDPESPEPEA